MKIKEDGLVIVALTAKPLLSLPDFINLDSIIDVLIINIIIIYQWMSHCSYISSSLICCTCGSSSSWNANLDAKINQLTQGYHSWICNLSIGSTLFVFFFNHDYECRSTISLYSFQFSFEMNQGYMIIKTKICSDSYF